MPQSAPVGRYRTYLGIYIKNMLGIIVNARAIRTGPFSGRIMEFGLGVKNKSKNCPSTIWRAPTYRKKLCGSHFVTTAPPRYTIRRRFTPLRYYYYNIYICIVHEFCRRGEYYYYYYEGDRCSVPHTIYSHLPHRKTCNIFTAGAMHITTLHRRRARV